MSTLVVLGFDDEHKADEARLKLLRLNREHLVDLEDAVVVVRDAAGTVKLRQLVNLTAAGAAGGGFWGALVGLLLLNPLAGLAGGAAVGGVAGALSDVGINDTFMRELGATLRPGTSALFVLLRRATMDKVVPELAPLQARVLHTSLAHEDESRLRLGLESAPRPSGGAFQS